MFKFLLIILLIFALIFIIVGVIFGKFLGFLRNTFNEEDNKTVQSKYKNKDVIYDKDDVVVLKGESNKKKDNK